MQKYSAVWGFGPGGRKWYVESRNGYCVARASSERMARRIARLLNAEERTKVK